MADREIIVPESMRAIVERAGNVPAVRVGREVRRAG
jgi:hypothetical protein